MQFVNELEEEAGVLHVQVSDAKAPLLPTVADSVPIDQAVGSMRFSVPCLEETAASLVDFLDESLRQWNCTHQIG